MWCIFFIVMTVHRDKLCDKTKEMYFLEFCFDNILYMFRIGKLFIFRTQFYCTCSLWYVSGVSMIHTINLLFLFEIRRNCLRSGRSRSLYLSTRRATKQIVVIIGTYNFYKLRTKFYPTSCCQG